MLMNIPSKFQLPSSSGLGLTVFGRYFHKPSLTYLANDKALCRTAPATPGLLKNKENIPWVLKYIMIYYMLEMINIGPPVCKQITVCQVVKSCPMNSENCQSQTTWSHSYARQSVSEKKLRHFSSKCLLLC